MSMNSKRHVLLTGMMGAGKTSVGAALAAILGWQFCDLDAVIVRQRGQSVADLFHQFGEAAFRQWEHAALAEELEKEQASVVALGGGAVTTEANHGIMRPFPVVWLDASVETMWARIEGSDRPLAAGRRIGEFRRLFEQRKPLYQRLSQFRVDAAKEPPDAAAEIARWLRAGWGQSADE